MPIDREIRDWRVKTAPGMNNKAEDLDLQEKWVSIAQNCRFENELGTVDKRDPVTFFNSTSIGSGPILGLTRFYTSSGTIKFVAVHGTQIYVGDDTGGTFTSIRTLATGNKRMTFAVYRDLLMMSNGFDPIAVYDGSTDNVSWELGACKAVLGAAGGGLTASSNYFYAISFDGDAVVTGAVSNTVATDGTNQTIDLSNIPLGPAGTTDRKIYRTTANGTAATLALVTTIADNTTTDYTDTTADGALGTAYPAVTALGEDAIPKGQIIQIHRERLFVSVDPNNPNKIYYSNAFLPHFMQVGTNLDFLEISPEDGDEITGIPIQLGVMICIKKNTIRKIHISSATSGANPKTWYADDPVSWIGSPAVYSITQTPNGVYFLGWDHWYVFDGAGSKPVMPEFDTEDILPAAYSDTVGFYHEGVMLAAYTDLTLASQFHNRIMRYNLKRQKLSYDQWTSATPSTGINGANCFASKSGDDETGELYYGDSVNGFVLKERTSEDIYRLTTKTECEQGTQTNVFIGGTENAPYIEPGGSTSAGVLPDDLIIFWDNETTTPGANWTEITGTYEDTFITIDSTSGTGTAASTHTHTVSGDLPNGGDDIVATGNQGAFGNFTIPGHTHTFSVTSDPTQAEPRHIKLRMFKSSGHTTETEFPIGAIIMWDQAETPTGWQDVNPGGLANGHYIKVGSTGLNIPTASSHTHDYSGTSTAAPGPLGESTDADQNGAGGLHTHSISGTTDSADLSSWEPGDNVSLHMIKKIGESDTWDGTDKFAYVLVEGAGTPTGWTIDTQWDSRWLKVGSSTATLGSSGGAAHTHLTGGGTSGTSSPNFGDSGNDRTLGIDEHTHFFSASAASEDAGAPAQTSFRIFKLQLGKMKDFNSAINVAAVGPFIWESPCIQINAEELTKLFWNETLPSGDDVTFETRVGATQVACEAAAYTTDLLTDPNGSPISSTPNIWFSYKMTFTAPDTTVSIPRVSFTNGFVVKMTYSKSASNAESAVAFKYETGFRNFNEPMFDKIFKKINSRHQGDTGSFDITWTTENATSTFTISLLTDPEKWKSYFPSDAMGTEVNFSVTKSDLNALRIKELYGVYSPMSEQV
jgi:hypothetical protein